jgi:hypothetical protein
MTIRARSTTGPAPSSAQAGTTIPGGNEESPRYGLGNIITFRLHDGRLVTGEISTMNQDASEPQYHVRIEHDSMYSSGYWVWEQEVVSQGVQLSLFPPDADVL